MKLLLEAHADPNIALPVRGAGRGLRHYSLWHVASVQVCRLCGFLWNVVAQDGTTSLYDACLRGDTPIAKQLLATSGIDTSRARHVRVLICCCFAGVPVMHRFVALKRRGCGCGCVRDPARKCRMAPLPCGSLCLTSTPQS